MFRDKDEELKRLQEALLEEDPAEQITEEEFEALLWEEDQGKKPKVYQNYSNHYGKDLRNFASGYQAYNTDVTDTDLDEYSQQVYEAAPSGAGWFAWLVAILMAAVVGVIVWLFFSMGGRF